jgi:hypothetical protein
MTETTAPRFPATKVVREDETHWWVACEGGCGNTSTQGKRTWKYVDGAQVEVRRTAPEATRCTSCGPFSPQELRANRVAIEHARTVAQVRKNREDEEANNAVVDGPYWH